MTQFKEENLHPPVLRDADALAVRVRALAPSMAPAIRRVADALVGDPGRCARLTVTDLARLTDTSEATVVRTARALGFGGYRDLRLALAALGARQAPEPPPAAAAAIAVDDPLAEVVAKLAREDRQTLAETAAGLDLTALEAAVAALATARRIDVYGMGASALVGQDLAQKLLRIGLIAHAHSDPHLAVTNAVQLRPGDVALAVTHPGGAAGVTEPLRVAYEQGATTVVITGHRDSALARYAGHVLTTPISRDSELRPAGLSGRTSQLLVIDCLFVGVAQRTYDRAAPALSASRQALAGPRRAARSKGRGRPPTPEESGARHARR